LSKIRFNDGLVTIGLAAFEGCVRLNNVEFPSTLKSTGIRSFEGCTALNNLTLNEGLEMIGWKTFIGCSSLEFLSLPSTVTKVETSAFEDCIELKEVVLNDKLESIENKAFGWRRGLRKVTMSSSLFDSINDLTFLKCIALKEFVLTCFEKKIVSIGDLGRIDITSKIGEMEGANLSRNGGNVVLSLSGCQYQREGTPAEWGDGRRILDLIMYHELMEASTIIDLAFWKARIMEIGGADEADQRQACRIEVPDPVKELIIQFRYGRKKFGGQ